MVANLWWVVVLAAALFCSVGFIRFVWFMSVGYGLAISGVGVALIVLGFVCGGFTFPACIPYLLFCLLMIFYGFRLGGFLLIRELKNKAYQAKLKEAGGSKKTPIFVSVVMWGMMAFLYFAQSSSMYFRLANGKANALTDVVFYVGFAISIIGVLLEAIADKQKSAQKKANPDMCATKGLFKICRCPNYFGEITFWTGMFISGISIYQGFWQWFIAALGYVLIVYIMFSGAKRLEKRHIKHYSKLPEYQEYANKTPIIIPFVPIYHLVKEEKNEK